MLTILISNGAKSIKNQGKNSIKKYLNIQKFKFLASK